MRIPIPDNLAPIARVFLDAGVPVYAVGGLVRNTLLSLPPADVDLASALTPEAVSALFSGTTVRVVPKAAEFGTVELVAGDVHAEHTTFRQESYARGGAHRPAHVALSGTLETDAFRRDFTVNALYADLATGEITDPTGGLADLKNRLLRTTSADPDAIMGSDALRVLRLVRFASELGFAVEEKTLASAKRFGGQLSDIAAERRRDEFSKILLCDARYPSLPTEKRMVLCALTLLDSLSVWDALVPELLDARDVAQRPDHHKHDVLRHLFSACAAMPPTLELRLSGLLHDVGKPLCKKENGNMYAHDAYSERLARRILTDLRYEKALVSSVCRIVCDHMYDIQGTAKLGTLRVQFVRWGRNFVPKMIAMREADVRGCGFEPDYVATRWRALYETMQLDGTPFSESELAVTGSDIMQELKLPPGADVGRVKEKLLLHCARHPEDNTRARLVPRMRDCMAGKGRKRRMLEAVVFDMDGVLLDSERMVADCIKEAVEEQGFVFDPDLFLKSCGLTVAATKLLFSGHYGPGLDTGRVMERKDVLYFSRLAAYGPPVKEGAKALLSDLAARGVKLALASSNQRNYVERQLAAAELLSYFAHVVTSEDVQNGKPDPEIYEKACALLGIMPERAFGVEDSYAGVRALHAAGMRAVMVPDMVPPDAEMTRLADKICPDLAAVRAYFSCMDCVGSVNNPGKR